MLFRSFNNFLVLTLILPFFSYWSGQFFGTRTDSTFCWSSPGFNNFLALTLILPFFSYWSWQFFGTRTDSTFCRYSPGFNNFLVLTLIVPFFRTGPDGFRYLHGFHIFPVLARIQQFSVCHTDSTIFPYRSRECSLWVL